mmetsp:Transcript_34092/g.80406  ORF Transcript_34092/g.80406 Transcript_34092/m.80406 type:complete len:180 (+) Transcript_34092:160-699(+)
MASTDGVVLGVDEVTSYSAKRLEEFKKRKADREKKEMRSFEKLLKQKEQGVKLTGEAESWFQKKAALDPQASAKYEVHQMAKKSMDSNNWAGELMKGTDTKFACVGKKSVDSELVNEVAGLVSYEEYKRKKQDLEDKEAAGELGDVGDHADEASSPKLKKKKKEKKVVLSFDADADEET